ncbi:MAG: SDR family oxidoreductase [Alphaproteobacteria bacterium]
MSGSTLDLFDLSGRRAIITGGGGLLGPVFAEALLDAGADACLVDANPDGLAQAASRLGGARTRVLDITDEKAVGETIAEAGPADILINAAAVNPKFEPDETGAVRNAGEFTGYSLENWRRSMDVNLTGAFLVTRAVCRGMEEKGRGAIVNIASHYGLRGPDQRIYRNAEGRQDFFKPADYSVTKAGILGFTKSLAAYYRDTEIRVNALTPGGAFNGHDETFARNYAARTILGRMARPDEYRGAILFLCSDASSYMTGANLVVDGGWTAL